MCVAAMAPSIGNARVELDGLVQISDSGCKIALYCSHLPTIGPGYGVAWIDLNDATEITDRRLALALFISDGSTVEIGVPITRVQFNGAVVINERSSQVSFSLLCEAAVIVGSGARVESNCKVVISYGAIPISFRQPLF